MGEWTPGPWHVDVPWGGFASVRGPRDELIFGLAIGGRDECQPPDVCAANARLIAAAPELAEALAELLHCPTIPEHWSAPARAALAKASAAPQPTR